MKLARVSLLIVPIFLTVSIGLPIPPCRRGDDVSCHRSTTNDISSSESGGGGVLMIGEGQADKKNWLKPGVQRESANYYHIYTQVETPHSSLSKRTTGPPSSGGSPFDDQSPRAQRAESPNPTLEEMRGFLSEEDIESYIADWRAGKEYKITLYRMSRGHTLTREEVQEFDGNRRSYLRASKVERDVQAELVRTNRARPKMVESYTRRMTRAVAVPKSARQRKNQLEALIDNDDASSDELAEYERLLARFQREVRTTREWRAKQKQRKKELEARYQNGEASDAERAEYEMIEASLQRARQGRKELRGEEKKRVKELKKKREEGIASDDELAELDDFEAKRQRVGEQKSKQQREARAKTAARIEELKRKKSQGVANAEELAELEIAMVKHQRRLEQQAAERQRRKARKAAAGQGTPSTETSSEGARSQLNASPSNNGQSNADPPLQSSSNPLFPAIAPWLNQLGKVLRTSRARSWLSPVPGVAPSPSLPFRFGAVP